MTQSRTKQPGTRRAVLDLLKQGGPQDAAMLSERLGVTAMAVRQHLYALRDEGLVEHQPVPRPVGRPAKAWRLTPKADRLFPDRHAELAAGLLQAIEQTFGADGVERVLAARTDQQVADYAAAMDAAGTLRARLEALAQRRSAEGYMAGIEPDGDDRWLLFENHCPICDAAASWRGLCAAELTAFRRALGPDVEVARTDHILAGARRCAYAVRRARGTVEAPTAD